MPTATLRGTVTEAAGDQRLAGAVVELNGQPVAVTDALGAFDIPGVSILWGANQLVVRHSSFVETVESDEFWITNPDELVEFSVELAVAAIPLPAVDVEAQRAPRIPERLRGFYERREKGSGTFWTQEEIILKDAPNMVELFRGVRFRAATTGRPCRPVVLVNGIVRDMSAVTPEQLAGVEIYRGIGFTPIEFSYLDHDCGLIVLWTRAF